MPKRRVSWKSNRYVDTRHERMTATAVANPFRMLSAYLHLIMWVFDVNFCQYEVPPDYDSHNESTGSLIENCHPRPDGVSLKEAVRKDRFSIKTINYQAMRVLLSSNIDANIESYKYHQSKVPEECWRDWVEYCVHTAMFLFLWARIQT